MPKNKTRVSTGIRQLDNLLQGLYIGDNVVWYDDAGSLSSLFMLNFIQESLANNKPIIYVSFDRSTKTLLDDLGDLAENQHLTILDCFTYGKGDGSEVFSQFYEKNGAEWPYQVILMKEPWEKEKVSEAIYTLHEKLSGDVRFIFESLTGMQDLWGGEDAILKFYTRTCPRLYELKTVAYWILEKGAHSDRLKAHINQIAQVAIDLAIKRGKSTITVLKADKRKVDTIDVPKFYWNDGTSVVIDSENRKFGKINLGLKLRELRNRRALSQKELAGLVGVTPSTISQIESDTIYPSLPALFKIAEILNVEIGSLFYNMTRPASQIVFSGDGTPVKFPDLPKSAITGYRILPPDFEPKADPYIIEIKGGKNLPAHFFMHKGEEIGYVMSGDLQITINNTVHTAHSGDMIHLTTELPSQWQNIGAETVRLLWIKIP